MFFLLVDVLGCDVFFFLGLEEKTIFFDLTFGRSVVWMRFFGEGRFDLGGPQRAI